MLSTFGTPIYQGEVNALPQSSKSVGSKNNQGCTNQGFSYLAWVTPPCATYVLESSTDLRYMQGT